MSYLRSLSSKVAEPGFKPWESGSRALCSVLPLDKTRGRSNTLESSGDCLYLTRDNLFLKHSTVPTGPISTLIRDLVHRGITLNPS